MLEYWKKLERQEGVRIGTEDEYPIARLELNTADEGEEEGK